MRYGSTGGYNSRRVALAAGAVLRLDEAPLTDVVDRAFAFGLELRREGGGLDADFRVAMVNLATQTRERADRRSAIGPESSQCKQWATSLASRYGPGPDSDSDSDSDPAWHLTPCVGSIPRAHRPYSMH